MNINTRDKVSLFIVGVFSMTQINVIGWIGISELVLFALAPILFVRNWALLKRHGFTTILWLVIFMFMGGMVANWMNQIPFHDSARGLASVYAIFAVIVCLHHFLWRNIDNMKWLLLGIAISSVVCTFVFQPGFDRYDYVSGQMLAGSEAMENRMGYSLFWFAQLGTWTLLPIQTLYLSVPTFYVVGVMLCLTVYALLSSGSRSGFGLSILALALLLIGGKRPQSMLRVRRDFLFLCMVGFFFAGGVTAVYKVAVLHGYMGETQYHKYEQQSARGSDLLSLLIGGRTGFFAAFYAAFDKPIIGHGSWALDYKGYYRDFLDRYGTDEEVDEYMKSAVGRGEAVDYLPGHSQIMSGWTSCGIFGLIFWCYILYCCFTTLKNNLAVVPQWYGYFCLALPGTFWGVFFSPFGSRIPSVLVFVACLFAKAVRDGRMRLPETMQIEIMKKAR
jgi:hypothetical protein